jgi:hypothetical protein
LNPSYTAVSNHVQRSTLTFPAAVGVSQNWSSATGCIREPLAASGTRAMNLANIKHFAARHWTVIRDLVALTGLAVAGTLIAFKFDIFPNDCGAGPR